MAAAYLLGRHPGDIVKSIVDGTSGNWPCGWGTGGPQLATRLRSQFGLQAEYHVFDAAALLTAMQNHHPVITQVWYRLRDGTFAKAEKLAHYVLVVGVSPTEVVINDPGRPPSRIADAQYVHVPLATFIDAWATSDHLKGVEVESASHATPTGDFSIGVSPTTVTVLQGAPASYSVSVQSVNGLNSSVNLTTVADVIRPGTGFAPQTVTPPANGSAPTTLTVITDGATPLGQSQIVVRGSSGSITHDVAIVLNVVLPNNVLPTVVTTAANSVGADFATLGGTVNPNGVGTSVQFEWGVTSAYGNLTTTQAIDGSDVSRFSKDLVNLTPSTTYHFRAVARNANTEAKGADISFTTLPRVGAVTAPSAATGSATAVGQFSATLNGAATPNGSATSAFFQWGMTTAYGNSTPPQAVGSGAASTAVSANLTGLNAGTTYHYRLVATNSAASTNADDLSFSTTNGVPPPTPPAPSISSVFPNPVTGSASRQTVTINGANFVNKPSVTLTWTGQPNYPVPSAQVTFVSSTQVQMAIDTSTTADSWTVRVTNPDGQSSNTVGFSVVAPQAAAPSISSVFPNPVTGSASRQTVTINGANFVNKPSVTLTWTGQPNYPVPSAQVTFVSSTQVQMAIDTTTTADSWTVRVTNPDGQSSNTVGFSVVAPRAAAPSISSVFPNPVTGSASRQTVTINGANFVNKPSVTLTWTGQPNYPVPSAQVTFVSSTQVQMAIDTTTAADSWTVRVTNPDGQSSNTVGFSVVAPQAAAPSISSVFPNPVTGSASRQTVTINGANFVNKPTITLTWTGQPNYPVPSAQVTFVSSTQVQMSITTGTAPDNWTVRVTNPDGQTSNTAPFTVR